ncbi:MAG: hypothetical protein B7Y45_04505 [Sphingomonas sp. 28-66-16]|nr:MAG: hypothetical protein B7Y45_04505 [Sphingomonas sp. 28-66-16]
MATLPLAARLGKRIAPPRFLLFCAAFAIGLAALIPSLGWARGGMAAFDAAALLFLGAVAPLLGSPVESMRRHARENDANRAVLLALTGVVSTVILIAVASELHGKTSLVTIALVVVTLALTWLFSNTVYALHYTHLFYSSAEGGGDRQGIDFPNCAEPTYWDFAYFSFTLGMTFQTSDVVITATSIRRTVIFHCLAAFVFNIGVLAFSINVLGGSS